MSTAFYSHDVCIEHEPGPGHPESPERLRAIMNAVAAEEFDVLDRREAPLADRSVLERAHRGSHIDQILEAVPASGYVSIDPDTILCPASGDAALRAAGAVCAAVEAVASASAQNAFCAVRPPGHHAEESAAMGFCIFNNIAIGALHAQQACGLERVAIIDFDVHHGNGTEAVVGGAPGILFASSHQFPAYPGTGTESRGQDIINVPLRPGAGSDEFRTAYQDIILPAVEAFDPDLIMISAGFDAHVRDPLCQLNVTTKDFAWVSGEITQIAARCCEGRIVSSLEGGYDLTALAEAVAAHLKALIAAGGEGS